MHSVITGIAGLCLGYGLGKWATDSKWYAAAARKREAAWKPAGTNTSG